MPHTKLIKDRLRFLEIAKDDIEELGNARRVLEPEIDRMLGQFYAHIASEPELMRVFADDKSLERAREAQKIHWLQTLFGGKFDSAYFDKAEQIGQAHARVGLTPNWYIGGYCKMLVQFVRNISTNAKKDGRNASPMIEAICKAVLLDLDVVIHCYLEAKNQAMLGILERVTNFTADMSELNSDLSRATAQVRESVEAATMEVTEEKKHSGSMARLSAGIEALTEKARQIDERINQLKTGDRLYLHKDADKTGTFAKLKALILGE